MERYFLPSYRFVYTLIQIDDHPWHTHLTMSEIEKLDPGFVRFVGQAAEEHEKYWRAKNPALFREERGPIFVLDTKIIHPHWIESSPRRPFLPWVRPQ